MFVIAQQSCLISHALPIRDDSRRFAGKYVSLISIALVGRKKTIEALLDVIDVADLLGGIVDLLDV